jgi:hypothetical protein
MPLEKPEYVAEIEGEYGPLTISERLVQKIWIRGEFPQKGLKTLEGRSLDILDLGQWNLLAGPDFKNIAIRVNGETFHGDAELHFFDSDWEAHGHGHDPAFRNVILHILVFPPGRKRQKSIIRIDHSLLFLELLPQGLESYAEEEALAALTGDQASEIELQLLTLGEEERRMTLEKGAQARWEGKVGYARRRIEAIGWEAACHMSAMEILGYRHNRPTMLLIAGDYTLKALRSGNYSAQQLFEAGKGRWRLSGTRPANHPKARLTQYLSWVKNQPHWPEVLGALAETWENPDYHSCWDLSRRSLRIPEVKKRISLELLSETVGGSRIENLVCDGFLPLLSAQTGRNLFPLWFHWFPGDVPGSVRNLYRRLHPKPVSQRPLSNGSIQGLLQKLLEKQTPKPRK